MPTIIVDPTDALHDVLGRIRAAAAGRRPVRLEIPPGAALFLTATEFRQLKDAIDQVGVPFVVGTADPLRLQLARMLGLQTSAEEIPSAPRLAPSPPRPSPPTTSQTRSPGDRGGGAPAQSAAAPTTSMRKAPNRRSASTTEPPPPPTGTTMPDTMPVSTAESASPATQLTLVARSSTDSAQSVKTSASEADADDTPGDLASQPEPIETGTTAEEAADRPISAAATSVTAAPAATPVDSPARAADESPSATPDASASAPRPQPTTAAPAASPAVAPDEPAEEEETQAERRSIRERLPGWRWPVWAALALALIIAGTLAAYWLIPSAVVTVALERQQLTGEVQVEIVPAGDAPAGDGSLAVEATRRTVIVTFEDSIPTTGTRAVPDATAEGTVRLANIQPTEIVVDAGTKVTAVDGVEFEFVERVVVPPGAVDAPSTATATVRATQPGTAGNTPVGELGGRLPSGLYFANRDGPIEGGTDRMTKTVAEADQAELRKRADAAIPELSLAEFAKVPEGDGVLPSSIEVGDGEDSFDLDVGQDAETLTFTATRPVSALTYDRDVLLDLAGDKLRDQLAASTPAGFDFAEETLSLSEPTLVEDRPDGGQVTISGTADARANLTDDERDDLVDALAGSKPDDAAREIETIPRITGFTIDYRPDWLPDRMPHNTGRITIRETSDV